MGQGLLGYLSAMERGPFASARLGALAKRTALDCRRLLLVDPDDCLLAVDPLSSVPDPGDPYHEQLVALGVRAVERVNDFVRQYESERDEKLTSRYGRLARFLASVALTRDTSQFSHRPSTVSSEGTIGND